MNNCFIVGQKKLIDSNTKLLETFSEINVIGYYYFDTPTDDNNNWIPTSDYDYIILFADEELFKEYRKQILDKNKDSKIINYKVLTLPEIDFNKYLKLYNNTPTVISNNCAGGLLLHTLGLEFKTPFIDLWMKHDDFIKILNNLQKYLNSPIKKFGYCLDFDKNEIPTCLCNDVVLKCAHYKTHDQAIDAWNRRVKRVDYDNIFVILITDDKKIIDEFVRLPYKNKFCFCPYRYNDPSVYQTASDNIEDINWYLLDVFRNKEKSFNLVDFLADGTINYYE